MITTPPTYGNNAYISTLTDDANDTKTMFGPSGNYSELNSSPWGNLGRLVSQVLRAVCFAVAPGSIATSAGVFAANLGLGPSAHGHVLSGFAAFIILK